MGVSITWQELVSQPERWRAVVTRSPVFPPLWEKVLTATEIVIFGSGSSFYLACSVGESIQAATGRRVRVLPSCELMLDPDRALSTAECRLAIGFSRSGESSEALLATDILRARDIPVLGITCTAGSSLTRLATDCMVVPEGDEQGLVMLRSFTCMLLACRLALGACGVGTEDVAGATQLLVAAGARMLHDLETPITALAQSRPFDRFVFLGSGADFPLAQEGALKLQEMATVTTEAYYTLEYRHGPKATGDASTLVTLFAPSHTGYGVSLVRDLAAQGLATLVIGANSVSYAGIATATAATPSGLPVPMRQLLAMLPVHLLAFFTAIQRGENPDAPRNLSKVVLF
jgi:glucosamine--fructose-6-phosphate aminotransferase (isomerizing)